VTAHAQKPDFVLLRLKCDGTCAETRFRLTAFEMWRHMRRKQISSYCVWNVTAHAQKPDFVLLRLKCDGTCAEIWFSLSAKLTSPFNSAGGVSSVDYWQPRCCASAVVMMDTPCSEAVWGVLATHWIRQFPLHFPLPQCVTVCHHISFGFYQTMHTRTALKEY